MRLGLTPAAVASIAAAWLACSSFDDAPATETTDASAPDGGAPSTTDAVADAGPGAACTAFFCDGFERTTGLDNGWNGLLPPSFAELSLSNLHAKSGAGSLQLKLLTGAGETGDRAAALEKELPVAATQAVLDFWLYYPQRPGTDTTVGTIPLRTLEGNVFVLLGADGIFVIGEQSIPDGSIEPITEPTMRVGVVKDAKPRHVILEVGTKLVANGPGARLTVDGESKDLLLVNVDPRPARVHLGSTYSAEGALRKEELLFYDDVIIDATPR